MENLLQSTGSGQPKGAGRWKSRTASLKVDMTPMVDLGFLLISSFIFTSSMMDPKALDLVMPTDKGAPMPVAETGALSIIVNANGELRYYAGLPPAQRQGIQTSTLTGIRKVIQDHKHQVLTTAAGAVSQSAKQNPVARTESNQKKLIILIKPTEDADYQTIVNLLDEMVINKIERYALVEPDANDLLLSGAAP